MTERFKVTRSSANIVAGLGSAGDVRGGGRNGRDEEAAMGRLLPQRNYPGEFPRLASEFALILILTTSDKTETRATDESSR